jgi:glycosyltransferase involved in cell wall biosynthesis
LLSKTESLGGYRQYENCLHIILVKKITAISLLRQIKRVLKQQAASILITGTPLFGAFAKTKTCLLTTSLLSSPENKSLSFFERKLQNIVFKNAGLICTAWEHEKNKIVDKYKITREHVHVIHHGLNVVSHEVSFEKRELIKSRYAADSEYFLLTLESLSTEETFIFLKAFSIFKKKLKSTMKLLVSFTNHSNSDQFNMELKAYRYKDDIIITIPGVPFTELLYGSYAIILNKLEQSQTPFALQTLVSKSPVICFNDSFSTEIFGDAALYFYKTNPEEIAEKMILIYKDEQLRQTLSEKQGDRHPFFSWHSSAMHLLQSIEKACG